VPLFHEIVEGDRLVQLYIKSVLENGDQQSKAALMRSVRDVNLPIDSVKVAMSFMKAVYLKYSNERKPLDITRLLTFYLDDLQPLL
jgi:uncharacterized membrane protein YcjF (UPF0283 family)